MSEWQPISTPPEDGVKAILYCPCQADPEFDGLDYSFRLAIYRKNQWREQGTNHDIFEYFDDEATHWMPLPTPPEKKG